MKKHNLPFPFGLVQREGDIKSLLLPSIVFICFRKVDVSLTRAEPLSW